ncbi:hypothetical protein [Salinispira pacifica]|uniref:Uncharacterized protein n=1 Tax=Salinispira pacifica TaxID=1307761 RepID=V5WDK2_9SPIO|nr:hypothetical protein [Salinispira pacifica]AHC13893.1 hypothetical protein L21SP2_0461 [Salinispira pacifica]
MKDDSVHRLECNAEIWLEQMLSRHRESSDGVLNMHASLVLLNLQGFSRFLDQIPRRTDQVGLITQLYRAFQSAFGSFDACLFSQLGDEYLFVVDETEEQVISGVRSLHNTLISLNFEVNGHNSLHLNSRMVCSSQDLNVYAIPGIHRPVIMPSAVEFLKDLQHEAQVCRARIVVGEVFKNSISCKDQFRLIALSARTQDDDPLGVFEWLEPYSEGEGRQLRENRRYTDRGISCFHAGLINESRGLFFSALQKAPFDSLPGRYLNRIQRSRNP